MKTCKQCGKAERVGYNALCRSCYKEYQRRWHKYRNLNIKVFIAKYKLKNPCIDCGKISLLSQFDHVKGKKEYDVAHAVLKSKTKFTIEHLQLELDKCVVRCMECHAIKTHLESNSFTGELITAQQNGTIDELLNKLESEVNTK